MKKINETEVIITARKRNEEVSENAIVQKSRPLFSLWQEKFSLFEYKLLDLYLGHINSHDINTKTVIMTKAELEQAIGSKRMNSDELDKKLRSLIRPVDIDTGGKYPLHVSLFETCYLNFETEPYQVEMQCTNSAFELIFNIEKIGYFKYKLRCILNIDSLYSYILFNYIEYNRYRTSWEVDIDELKEILNCNSPTYETFKRFNDLILKKCYLELTQKTELRYSYTTIKRGRKVIAIRFTVEPLLTVDEAAEPIPAIEETSPEVEERIPQIVKDMLFVADKLSLEQIKQIFYRMKEKGYSDIFLSFKRIYQTALNGCKDETKLTGYINRIIENDPPQRSGDET